MDKNYKKKKSIVLQNLFLIYETQVTVTNLFFQTKLYKLENSSHGSNITK